MGWARTMILGDVGNRLDIQDCEEDIKVLKSTLMEMNQEDREKDQELTILRRENDELKLYLSALIRLLTARNVLTKEELRKMVNAIDTEDGAMDHKNRNDIL
jgi:nitrogen fixation/metabolism regulation signal transduction histidine kinase